MRVIIDLLFLRRTVLCDPRLAQFRILCGVSLRSLLLLSKMDTTFLFA